MDILFLGIIIFLFVLAVFDPLGGSEQRRCKFSQLGYRRQSRQIQDNHYNSLSRCLPEPP